MKFNINKTEYCCSEFRYFLGKVETYFSQWKSETDAPIKISFSIISGYIDFELKFCPFCGELIEFEE